MDNLLTSLLDLLRDAVTLLGLLPKEDAGDLGCADAEEEEVDGSEAVACVSFSLVASVCTDRSVQKVSGLDDEAPAGPDQTGSHEGGILTQGERFGGTGKVCGTSKDETPLQRVSVSVSSRIEEDHVANTFITGALSAC